MKRMMIVAIALLTAVMANAQASFQLGYLGNNSKTETALGSTSDSYGGFMVGADYNLTLTGDLKVAPGLNLDLSFDDDYTEFGFFIPIDFNYGFQINDQVSLSVFAGPTAYLGILSQSKTGAVTYDYYENDYSRFELLLGGGLWCDIMDLIRVKAGYKFGLLDNCKLDAVTNKNNCLYLSVGYLF
ncbi:MAG: outer membrane beta-barrel protein [Bacteroidales bacterium]|nr:outer membrane beta-barrel protein [Bacteroidales bacterium]